MCTSHQSGEVEKVGEEKEFLEKYAHVAHSIALRAEEKESIRVKLTQEMKSTKAIIDFEKENQQANEEAGYLANFYKSARRFIIG